MLNFDSNWKSHLDLRTLFIVLLIVHIITFVASYAFYNGNIDIAKEALSDCGAVNTRDGEPNIISMVIFSSGMMICAFISALISHSFRNWKGLKYGSKLIRSMRAASVGYAILMFPNDISEVIHGLGLGMVIFSLWYMITLLLRELRERISKMRFWLSHICLGVSIIIYLIECTISLGTCSYTQKVAFFGLAVVFFVTVNEIYRYRKFYSSRSP
jgi:hypothetical protein